MACRPRGLLLLLAMAAATAAGQILDEVAGEVSAVCRGKCPAQNRTDDGHVDMGCGNECAAEQCATGCSLWIQAMESSCKTVCNATTDTISQKDLYCVAACNEAVNVYYLILTEKIGTPPAPALVPDSLKSTSLELVWEGSRYSNLIYLVQWRYEEIAATWQYYRNKTWGNNSTIKVDNLQPYTKYRFRVAILLSEKHTSTILSAHSVVIITLPDGPPSSAPVALRVTVVDSHRVSLSWEPGPFLNGPLISYVLKINQTAPNENTPDLYYAINDFPSTEKTLSYMFQSLTENTTYKVQVAMRNEVGEGPSASVNVTTPILPKEPGYHQQPILIVGGEHSIVQQKADLSTQPIVIYNTTHKIQGVGIHVGKSLLFLSDSSGRVLKLFIHPQGVYNITTILTPNNYKPLDLSVDWLNEHLYILGEINFNISDDQEEVSKRWQIIRCDFDGKFQTVAIAGFLHRPVHIEVDPYNGYLFWVQQKNSSGLYRLDLAHISNGVKKEISPEKILDENNLGAFTVDHTNFRIFVAHLKNNTMLSVSLNGHECMNFRPNIQRPRFESVKFISYAYGLFYWTNGKEIVVEEYHKRHKTYYHNTVPAGAEKHFNSILMFLRMSQPIPLAVNPPIALQSVMGFNHAKISWQPPHLLGHQGNGAWQQWEYDLLITDSNNGSTLHRIDKTTSFNVNDLQENTIYSMKVAAVTSSGVGPWSSEFTAKTLSVQEKGAFTSILWSSQDGLLRSDLTGDNIQTLITKTQLKNAYITDISWFKDLLYLVTNSTNVIRFNMTSRSKEWMHDMENVGSLAVDWLGNKLYWSNPKQQLITRGNLRGGNREPVPIVTIGKELKIDSLNGFIYWNTGHAIESSRLNGENKIMYYRPQLFRKQVMGLTVDLKGKLLYWIVHEFEGSKLYKAPTADVILLRDSEIQSTLISSLSNSVTMGPLCYFSDRLFWLEDDSHAVISDVTGHNKANLNSTAKAFVKMIAVIGSTLQNIPGDQDEISVIPEALNESSIKITGKWDEFTISWDPIALVNYGQIFYEIKIEYNNNIILENTTTESYIECLKIEIPAYSSIDLSIRAYTYWGAAPTSRIRLYSPQTLPSRPNRPRIFVLHQNSPIKSDNEINLAFRWDPPIHENGIIKGYIVDCWYKENTVEHKVCNGELVPTHRLESILKTTLKNATFYFQVSAFNDAGFGPPSENGSSLTNIEFLPPQLAISYEDSIQILDLDLQMNNPPINNGRATDFTINIAENCVYWINGLKEILVSKLNETDSTKKIMTINGTGLSITVDWINRLLYWSQLELNYSVLYELDLNVYDIDHNLKIRRITQTQSNINSIQVSPLTRTLYWIEMADKITGKIVKSNVEGTSVRPFFGSHHIVSSNSHKDRRHCNCPENPMIHSSYILDLTVTNIPKLFWINNSTKNIEISDIEGCQCRVIVKSADHSSLRWPPQSITIDNKYLYWSDLSSNVLCHISKKKYDTDNAQCKKVPTGHKILGIGNKIQPYYSHEICLIPKQVPLKVLNYTYTSTSITIVLPDPSKHDNCYRFNMATPYYIVTHGLNDIMNVHKYITNQTFNHEFRVDGLKPYTEYFFMVQVNNYYGLVKNITPIIGPKIIIRTDPGAPMPVTNIRATVISPNHVTIEWQPNEQTDDIPINNSIIHEVYYRTEKEFLAKVNPSDSTFNKAELTKLMPSQNYLFWVRSRYSLSTNHVDSENVSIKTYPEPNKILHKSSDPYSIHISWKPYNTIPSTYYIEYVIHGNEDWKEVKNKSYEYGNNTIDYIVKNLHPKTIYHFRIKLFFNNSTEPYYWPKDSSIMYETKSDRPSPPGKPVVQQLSNSVFQLQWKHSNQNGGEFKMYRLYGENRSVKNESDIEEEPVSVLSRQIREPNQTVLNTEPTYLTTSEQINLNIPKENWKLLYNGTDNYWLVDNLIPKTRYIFYVQALNSEGLSNFSEQSEEFDFPLVAQTGASVEYGLFIGGGVAVLFLFFFLIAAPLTIRYMKNDKKAVIEPQIIIRGPDVELATLRELPRIQGGGGFFQQSTNILYNNGLCNPTTDADIALLPHIRRDQITLTRFLGSGAFGEVFEGKAKDLDTEGSETRVAIKTLRKGATDQEKTEFLQEAQLMSNFKHEHILRMLGVCLDNDPHFIIMELMEGGDLLSYLRSRRPMLYTNDSLTLYDLLLMCRDVTKGCRYLEEMHFVHRDLACRNCLVSHQLNGRVVKIGDFGLARDIYKNDYYRKEGEGLLPVRWMAVECLTDGVFSRASDVWAWAVLCWEVTTLGQQPYSALLNHAVMRYVRGGGTLPRPANCPAPLFALLKKCWCYNHEQRPTFKYCLEALEELIDSIKEDVSLIASIDENTQYITVIPDVAATSVTNKMYFADVNQNTQFPGNSHTLEHSIESPSVTQTARSSLQAENSIIIDPPKYLELIYDGAMQETEVDGYEIPRSSVRSNVSRRTVSEDSKGLITKIDNSDSFAIYADNENQTHNRLSRINNVPELISESASVIMKSSQLQNLIPSIDFNETLKHNDVPHSCDDEKLSHSSRHDSNKLLNGFIAENHNIFGLNSEAIGKTSC